MSPVPPESWVLVGKLVGSCPSPAFLLGPDQKVLECNLAAVEALNILKGQIIGKQLGALLQGDPNPSAAIPNEVPLRIDDGQYYRAKIRVSPIHHELSVVYIELPSISETSFLLQEANRIQSNAARLGKIGAWELHLRTGFVFWNDETRRIHEVPPDYDPNLEGALNFYPPEARAQVSQAVKNAADYGTPFDLVLPHNTASGARRWVRVFGERLVGPDGYYRLSGAFQDITDTHELALDLKVVSERYHLATTAAGVGIWDFNFVTQELTWDAGMFKLYQRRPRKKALSVAFFRRCIAPEHRKRDDELMQRSIAADQTYENTFDIILPNRQRRTVKAYATLLRDQDGSPVRMIGTNWDVTESARSAEVLRQNEAALERRVRERTIELENANRELEAFGYAISHDLRAPLRAITSYAQILEKSNWDELSTEIQNSLWRISRAVKRMNVQFDVMRNLAKISQVPVRTKPIDLVRILHRIVADLEADDTGPRVQLTYPPRLPAYGDPQLAEVALRNLLGNSWKFTRDQAIRRVALTAELSAEAVTVTIADNGPGIPETMIESIFEPFDRGASSAHVEGTGIGLSLTRRAIERQGGRIWAEPRDAGAAFRFTLPAVAQAE